MTALEYAQILFADNGYDTSAQRKGWLEKRFGVSYFDDLAGEQKHQAIEMLKNEKAAHSGDG
jgi:hypothetical protein